MKQKSYHIVPNGKNWSVKKGGGKNLKSFDTKKEAEKYGIEVSKNQEAELYFHGKNGKIQNKNSYGNDPCPPKDKK